MIPFAAALAALGILLAHGVAAAARRPQRFPSLQFVPRAARSWRLPAPLAERGRLALRLAFVALLACAFLAARREEGPRRVCAVVLDPLAPREDVRRAALSVRSRLEESGAAVLTLEFDGDTPRVRAGSDQANASRRAEARLAASTESRLSALRRAAHEIADTSWVVSDFRAAAWLSSAPLPFVPLRVPPAKDAPVVAAPPSPRPSGRRVFLAGKPGDSARVLLELWAAALAANEGTRVEPVGAEGLAALDASRAVVVADGARPETRSFAERGGAVVWPGGDPVAVAGVVYDEAARLASGREAEGERFETSFPASAGLHPLVGSLDRTRVVMSEAEVGRGRVVRAAGSSEDLGRLAYDGALARLARVAAAYASTRPLVVTGQVPLDRFAWRRGNQVFPVGLVDVPPGRYIREDAAAEYVAEREPDLDSDGALDDTGLPRVGAERERPAPRVESHGALVLALLLLALALRLLDLPARRPSVLALFAFELAVLLLLVLDVRPSIRRSDRRLVRLVLPPGADLRLERELTRALGPRFDVRSDRTGVLAESRPAADRNEAAEVQVVVGSLDTPPDASEAAVAGRDVLAAPVLLVGNANGPAVRLVAVDAPAAVGVGEPASLLVTLLTRHVEGDGTRLELADRGGTLASTAIPPGTAALKLALPLIAAKPGAAADLSRSGFAAAAESSRSSSAAAVYVVRTRGAGAPDSRLVHLEARSSPRRILLVAGAPSWEARRALESLAAPHVNEAVTAAFGRSVGLSRGMDGGGSVAKALDAVSLSGYDAVILESVGKEECPLACARGVFEAVERGLGLVILGDPARALAGTELLPARVAGASVLASLSPSTSPLPLSGELQFGASPVPIAFEGFPPVPADLAPGSLVLGRLARRGEPLRPWIVGREVGRGRVVSLLAPDLWRADEARRVVLREALGFVLASERAPESTPVAADALLLERRARLAHAARLSRVGYAEADTPAEAAAILSRLPDPPERRVELRARRSAALAAALLALVTLETLVRRRSGGV